MGNVSNKEKSPQQNRYRLTVQFHQLDISLYMFTQLNLIVCRQTELIWKYIGREREIL